MSSSRKDLIIALGPRKQGCDAVTLWGFRPSRPESRRTAGAQRTTSARSLSSPASAVAICSYFETFGDIEAVDLSGMFNSESSKLSAVYIKYFDSRAPFLAMNHLKGVSSFAPKVVEVDPLGTGKPETIDIINVGETLSCCEKFGDIELINDHSPSSSSASAYALDLDSVATTVTFYDSRAADNFLRVLQSVKDMRRASCSLGEEKPSIESTERRATVPVLTSGMVKRPSDLVASMSSIQSAALRDTLPLLHHPSELQSPTTEGFTVQQRLADLFRQYDSSVHAPASDSDLAEYSGTPRDANRVTPANAAETLAVIIGSHHQRAAAGSSNSAAAKEARGKLEISLAEKAALMCDTVREWGKPFSPPQPPQTTVGEGGQRSEDGGVEEMQDVQVEKVGISAEQEAATVSDTPAVVSGRTEETLTSDKSRRRGSF